MHWMLSPSVRFRLMIQYDPSDSFVRRIRFHTTPSTTRIENMRTFLMACIVRALHGQGMSHLRTCLESSREEDVFHDRAILLA